MCVCVCVCLFKFSYLIMGVLRFAFDWSPCVQVTAFKTPLPACSLLHTVHTLCSVTFQIEIYLYLIHLQNLEKLSGACSVAWETISVVFKNFRKFSKNRLFIRL